MEEFSNTYLQKKYGVYLEMISGLSIFASDL